MFAKSHSEGYRHLVVLADSLHRMHGLTLQPQKTDVLPSSEFKRRVLRDPEDRELTSLEEKFERLIEELGLESRYEPIDYDDLDKEQRALVDSMNLSELFAEEVKKRAGADQALLRFILRRLSQLGDEAVLDLALKNLDVLYPIFPDVILYLNALADLSPGRKKEIGAVVLGLLGGSIVSELPFHRLWSLSLFTSSAEWDNDQAFVKLYNAAVEDFSRRELILAMGRGRQDHWFKAQWRGLLDLPPWPRRALLAAASCMPADARKHWYKAVEPQLDPLEKAIVAWAQQKPFGHKAAP